MLKRRTFLKTLAGLTLTAARAPRAFAAPLRVGVIGGGIIGTSVALHLAEAGAHVTLLEKVTPSHGATQNSFGFINIFDPDRTYQKLRIESYLAYRRLDARLPLGVTWGGYINWASAPADGDQVRAAAAMLDGTAFAVRRIDATTFRRLSPAVEPGPLTAAFYSPYAGHVDPVGITYRMLRRAQALGVDVRYPCAVEAIEVHGPELAVRTDQGRLPLDRLVVAAGVDSPALLAPLGYRLPLRHAPGILAHSVPTRILTRLVYDGPDELEFKQMASGRIVGEWHFEPPDIPVHQEIRTRPVDYPTPQLRAQHGQRILERIGAVLPAVRGIALERLTLGFRPMPIDGFPVVGPVPGTPGVYVAVTHSGITLAAILGHYLSNEIVTGVASSALAPYRPGRFAS